MKQLTTLLAVFISCSAIASEGINFQQDMSWAQIKAKAQKEKKMIFFDAYTTWCGPCKYLETSVYTDESVASYYNDNFINVKFDMEAGEGIKLAEEFGITAYPTLLFFTAEGKLIHKNVGALKVPDFIDLGKDATNPDKQYFTLKQKIIDKQASNDDFLKWTKLADDMEDNNRGAVASDWLSSQKDILATAELAKATMLYTDVNETQLAYLYKEKKKIQELLGWDADKVNLKLYYKLFTLALSKYDNTKGTTIEFSNLIKKFEPTKANYALKSLQVLNALNAENDQVKAMSIITNSLKGKNRLTLKETAGLLFDFIPRFDEDAIANLKTNLALYIFTPTDKGNECWLYLMQVVCYSRLGENTKAKTFAEKANKQGCLPLEYKNFLKESFGLGD